MNRDSQILPPRTLTQLLFIIFLRLMAISCFWFALQYWALLTGYSLGGRGRFDMLILPWRVAATWLAIAFPVAALGLWLTVSWGPVIWVSAAGAQVLMYTLWSDYFGYNPVIVVLHGLAAVIYTVFRVLLWQHKRAERRKLVGVDLP